MDLEKALLVLGLKNNPTINDLNSAYRSLAKRFHPDFHRGNEKWAHNKMTELNLAYECALRHLTSIQEKPRKQRYEFSGLFNMALNKLLDGLYLYYQYGLENIHLRKEGVRRFRYRDALKLVREGLSEFERIKCFAKYQKEAESTELFIEFSRAFLQNMLINRVYEHAGHKREYIAYKHYVNGGMCLDYAIKDVFFGDMLISIRDGNYYTKLAKGYEEFLVVVTNFQDTSWVTETLLKMYLMEMLTKVIRVLKSMQH